MVALCVWLLVNGCFSMDRKRRAAMVLPPAFSRLNRSSGRVPKAITGSANVSASARAPAAVWPDSRPENCQDFIDCVGGTDGLKLGAKLGECCTKWGSDTVVQDTYCQVRANDGFLFSLFAGCNIVRGEGETDEEHKADVEALGLPFSDVVAGCDAACNSVPASERPGFCDARALRKCLESSGEGVCCGRYYNARGYVPGKCDGTTFDYTQDCLASDGVPTPGRGQLCNDFCDNINKDIVVSVYRYGSTYDYGWDDYCATAREFRECVAESNLGRCCALHSSPVIDCVSLLSSYSYCYSYPGTKELVCNSYCDNIDPYYSKSTAFCGSWGYAKCSAGITAPTTLLPQCCAYNPTDQWRAHCRLKVYNTRYEEDQIGYETTTSLTDLCSLLRDPLGSRVPCGLEVSKSALDGYCTRFCDSLDQSSKRQFWWCDAGASLSYQACVAGVEVGEYLEEARRVSTYHSRPFEYDPYESLQDWADELGHAWETTAKCCGENPAAADCGSDLRRCEQLYDSKYNDPRDEIDDFEFPETRDDIQEYFSTAAEFCRTICKNMDDEPGWCDNVPGRPLLAGEIAAIVLGCVLFVAIVGIVVLVILYLKKPGVGGAPSTG